MHPGWCPINTQSRWYTCGFLEVRPKWHHHCHSLWKGTVTVLEAFKNLKVCRPQSRQSPKRSCAKWKKGKSSLTDIQLVALIGKKLFVSFTPSSDQFFPWTIKSSCCDRLLLSPCPHRDGRRQQWVEGVEEVYRYLPMPWNSRRCPGMRAHACSHSASTHAPFTHTHTHTHV